MLQLKILLILNATAAGILGLLAVFFPAVPLRMLQIEAEAPTMHLVRIVGVQLFALMMLMWFLVWSDSAPLLRSMSWALFLTNVFAVVASVYHAWLTRPDPINVGVILIHAALATAYGRFATGSALQDSP